MNSQKVQDNKYRFIFQKLNLFFCFLSYEAKVVGHIIGNKTLILCGCNRATTDMLAQVKVHTPRGCGVLKK